MKKKLVVSVLAFGVFLFLLDFGINGTSNLLFSVPLIAALMSAALYPSKMYKLILISSPSSLFVIMKLAGTDTAYGIIVYLIALATIAALTIITIKETSNWLYGLTMILTLMPTIMATFNNEIVASSWAVHFFTWIGVIFIGGIFHWGVAEYLKQKSNTVVQESEQQINL